MHMRGIRLNAGKTHILSKSDAYRFFQIAENSKVDAYFRSRSALKERAQTFALFERKCFKSLRRFLRSRDDGHKDKLIRRYIGLFAKLRSDVALDYCLAHFATDPILREVSLGYFLAVGPRVRIFNMLESFVRGGFALDDIALCQIAKLITNWEIATNSVLISRVRRVATDVYDATFLRRSPHFIWCSPFGC